MFYCRLTVDGPGGRPYWRLTDPLGRLLSRPPRKNEVFLAEKYLEGDSPYELNNFFTLRAEDGLCCWATRNEFEIISNIELLAILTDLDD